jgi:hypothetical protein
MIIIWTTPVLSNLLLYHAFLYNSPVCFNLEMEQRVEENSRRRSRTILTEHQVVEILKYKLINETSDSKIKAIGSKLAKMFGVSDKTIRDIWKGRTWRRLTLRTSKAPQKSSAVMDSRIFFNKGCAHESCMWCYKDRTALAWPPSVINENRSSIDTQLFLWTIESVNTAIQDPFQNDWLRTP